MEKRGDFHTTLKARKLLPQKHSEDLATTKYPNCIFFQLDKMYKRFLNESNIPIINKIQLNLYTARKQSHTAPPAEASLTSFASHNVSNDTGEWKSVEKAQGAQYKKNPTLEQVISAITNRFQSLSDKSDTELEDNSAPIIMERGHTKIHANPHQFM